MFFVEEGQYRVQARENFDRGLPLALIALESRGMMKDRVYGITQTIYHAPYYTRHVVGPAQVLEEGGEARTRSSNEPTSHALADYYSASQLRKQSLDRPEIRGGRPAGQRRPSQGGHRLAHSNRSRTIGVLGMPRGDAPHRAVRPA